RQKQGFALKSGGLPTWQGDMGLGFSGEGMKFLPNGVKLRARESSQSEKSWTYNTKHTEHGQNTGNGKYDMPSHITSLYGVHPMGCFCKLYGRPESRQSSFVRPRAPVFAYCPLRILLSHDSLPQLAPLVCGMIRGGEDDE
ncbi:hypothetical protein Tco_0198935, partial [Tanacetum coccineum]